MQRRGFLASFFTLPFAAKLPAPKLRHVIVRTKRLFNGHNAKTGYTVWRTEEQIYRPEQFGVEDLKVIVPAFTISSGQPFMSNIDPIRILGLQNGAWHDVMVIEAGYFMDDTFTRRPIP